MPNDDELSTAKASAVDVREVLATINRARAAYGASRLDELPNGLKCNPSHCPIARAFRMGVSDRLFFAVGSGHLRVEAVGQDAAKIAYAIRTTWYGQTRFVEGDPVTSIIRLPDELRAFVEQFDAGALPEYVGAPEDKESATVAALTENIGNAKVLKLAQKPASPAYPRTSAREAQSFDEHKTVA